MRGNDSSTGGSSVGAGRSTHPPPRFGALLTRWVAGGVLVHVTDVILIGFSVRLLSGTTNVSSTEDGAVHRLGVAACGRRRHRRLHLRLARQQWWLPARPAVHHGAPPPIKPAVPGTIVHACLRHIDWALVAAFGSDIGSAVVSGHTCRIADRCTPTRAPLRRRGRRARRRVPHHLLNDAGSSISSETSTGVADSERPVTMNPVAPMNATTLIHSLTRSPAIVWA